ncbi:uncharacterized protein LOC9651199 [Selaginella moellendorffii]|nr:uncharacterized protein LOC9651199 [Selaginella moellendorffii]|eukprot:XP_002983737.2 uncharacterized protein LOC9651199 [Selaginella moellendorffii]
MKKGRSLSMAMAMASCSGRIPSGLTLSRRSRHRFVAAASEDDSRVAIQEEASSAIDVVKKEFQARRYHVENDKMFDILGASLAVPLRLGTGALVQGYKASFVPKEQVPPSQYSLFDFGGQKLVETAVLGARPQQPIQIYEFEGCPFCRKVREAATILDLDILFYPCPKDGPTYRPKAIELGGKKQFPYMVDPNTDVAMYESDEIIKYLVDKYGNGKVPFMLSLGFFTTLTAGLAMLGRAGKGSQYVPARKPDKPLKIWAYELSPFCKIVRERLVELELPHVYYNAARGSPKRNYLLERTGIYQVPFLEDPNTGVEMFESSEIIKYLNTTYAL